MSQIRLFLFVILSSMALAQFEKQDKPSYQDFQVSSERYLTDKDGNIAMYVNVWGSVPTPGRHLVYDGVDFATLLAIVGGPNSSANLKKVRLYREIPENNELLSYSIDLEEFLDTGDRSNFIKIKAV